MTRFIGLITLLTAVSAIALLTWHNQPAHSTQALAEKPANTPPQLFVAEFQPRLVRDRITSHGRVRARWTTTLAAEVDGRITHVNPRLIAGARFQQGELLATIEDSAYQLAVANAETKVLQAQRLLLEQQERSVAAIETWEISGFKGEVPALVALKPQLGEAQQALNAARMQLTKSRYDLNNTRIIAPYDGVIVKRFISPGDFVQRSSRLLTFHDISVLDIQALLSPAQIIRLGTERHNKVQISSQRGAAGSEKSTGHIANISHQQDPVNHWQQVTISIDNPQAFVPGEFVELEFSGQETLSVTVPEHYLSADGYTWIVDRQNRINRHKPQLLYRDQQGLTFAVANEHPIRLTANRNGYPDGLKVTEKATASELSPAKPRPFENRSLIQTASEEQP